jgi:hypothetical protein
MRRWCAAIVIGLVAAVSGASAALASTSDQQSATTALGALRTFVQSVKASSGAVQSDATAFIDGLRKNCPDSLPATNKGLDSGQQAAVFALELEATGDLVLSATQPWHAAEETYLRHTEGLHWQASKLSTKMAASTKGGRASLSVKLPGLCADVRTASASHFKTLPSDTRNFNDAVVSGPNAPSFPISASVLKPYLPASAVSELKAVEASTKQLSDQIDPIEKRANQQLQQVLTGS